MMNARRGPAAKSTSRGFRRASPRVERKVESGPREGNLPRGLDLRAETERFRGNRGHPVALRAEHRVGGRRKKGQLHPAVPRASQ